MRRGRLWVLGALAVACSGPGTGRDVDGDGGPGGKADNAAELEDVPHQTAVQLCEDWARVDRSRGEGDLDAELQAEIDRRDCLILVNDLVAPTLQDAVDQIELDPQPSAADALIDLRGSASFLCEGFVAASDATPGLSTDIAIARCEGHMERFAADLIDRHADLGVEPFFIGQAWRRYGACYDTVEEIPTDDPQTALREQIESYRRLAECIHTVDSELSDELGARAGQAYEKDPTRVADMFRNELDAHAGWTFQFCTVLAAASPPEPQGQVDDDAFELHQVHCTSTALELRGRLLGTITGLEPDDTLPPTEPEDPQDPEPVPEDPVPEDPDPPSQPGQACYPGADRGWSTCLPVIPIAEIEDSGYDYPAGFGGNPNYRPPVAVLDLDAVDPQTQVSADFTLAELAQRHKGRYAIVQPHAVASLQALRDQIGAITVNSGYRSPAYNASVDGATFSRHMYGDGFDLDPVEVGLSTAENACESLGGKLVEYGSHVHCDFRFDDPDKVFFGSI